MAKVKGKTKKRGERTFALGPPGAVLRVEYPLETRSEILWSFITPGLMVAGGGLSAIFVARGLGIWLSLGFVAVGLWLLSSAFRKEPGVLYLDAERLQIGPRKRTKDIAIGDVQGTARGVTGVGETSLDQLVVHYALRPNDATAGKKARFDMAVALVPRAVADEIEKRLAIRRRAATVDDARTLEAAEALYLAGSGVIGVHHVRGAWVPFSDTQELAAITGAHPFRGASERIPICVSPAVWDAIRSVPEVEARVEAIVIPD